MAVALVKPKNSELPINEESLRPYRIWNAKEKANLAHRCYSVALHAHWAALHQMFYTEVNVTLEVYNIHNGKLIGQYTLKPDGKIQMWYEKKSLDEVFEHD